MFLKKTLVKLFSCYFSNAGSENYYLFDVKAGVTNYSEEDTILPLIIKKLQSFT